MNRTALRLALITLLSNNFKAPFPTLAEGRISDSPNTPINQTDMENIGAEITVFTDDDNGESLDDQSGGPFLRTLEVVIECYFPAYEQIADKNGVIEVDENGDPVLHVSVAQTDSEMEAVIDVIERQVRFALEDPSSKWWTILRGAGGLMPKIISWDSRRWGGEPEAGIRFAFRQIKLSVEIPDEPAPEIKISATGQREVINAVPESIEKLLTLVKADGGMPDYIQTLVNMLNHYSTPHHVTSTRLKLIRVSSNNAHTDIKLEE